MHPTIDQDVARIVAAAADAAPVWACTPRAERAVVLRSISARLSTAADDLIPIARHETHLTEARLRSELARTVFQLDLFADTLDDGSYLDVRIDPADPAWPVAPRPDLRRTKVPLGPVVVFAASNFPFAFSVAGGDTASALAAGCSVILKAHPGHPDLSRATAAVVIDALTSTGAPDGVFHLIEGEAAGVEALRDRRVRAGAFTGSIAGGRALFDVAGSRPEPIPFFGELGSVNPVFVTRAADLCGGAEIAADLIGSFTLGAGQFCTKPGVVLVPRYSVLVETLGVLDLPAAAPLLNDRITAGYRVRRSELADHESVRVLRAGPDPLAPTILVTSLDAVRADSTLLEECFGPTVLVVEYDAEDDLLPLARSLAGQLTASVFADEHEPLAPALIDVLSDRAGRLLWRQWPTGVAVTAAQQHGGPYPATTAPASTSVGTAAIDRFIRPVAFQGFPLQLLPSELREAAPEQARRRP
jgi:NADP-dependent aldehyde dehydrogenase